MDPVPGGSEGMKTYFSVAPRLRHSFHVRKQQEDNQRAILYKMTSDHPLMTG